MGNEVEGKKDAMNLGQVLGGCVPPKEAAATSVHSEKILVSLINWRDFFSTFSLSLFISLCVSRSTQNFIWLLLSPPTRFAMLEPQIVHCIQS